MNRILNWFRQRTLEGDLDRELQYHIDRRVTDLIHSGLPEPEARRRVALELGSETQLREEVRDIWLNRWLRDFVHDLRFSARSIVRSPSLTAAAVLTLALGIGATTALYSLIDQIVLRALPVDHPERLASRLFPYAGRANRPILEHRAYAGGTLQQFRRAGAAALVGWPVRCDVFRRDPAHARNRYSIGAGGDTCFYHLAGAPGCAGNDRRRNRDCATLRLGVGPSC